MKVYLSEMLPDENDLDEAARGISKLWNQYRYDYEFIVISIYLPNLNYSLKHTILLKKLLFNMQI